MRGRVPPRAAVAPFGPLAAPGGRRRLVPGRRSPRGQLRPAAARAWPRPPPPSSGAVRSPARAADRAPPDTPRTLLGTSCSLLPLSGRRVADRLDVVAVRIEHERPVVVRVVELAHARLADVSPTRRQGGRVEGVDGFAVLGRERHVHAAARPPIAPGDPEERKSSPRPPTSGAGSIKTLIPSGARASSV